MNITNFEKLVNQELENMENVSAIKYLKSLYYELYKHAGKCRAFLKDKREILIESSRAKGICPKCGEKMQFERDTRRDEYVLYLGKSELLKRGGDMVCPKCFYNFEV